MHGRNIDVKGYSDQISDGNEELVTGNWKRGDPCHRVAKSLADLCPGVL